MGAEAVPVCTNLKSLALVIQVPSPVWRVLGLYKIVKTYGPKDFRIGDKGPITHSIGDSKALRTNTQM